MKKIFLSLLLIAIFCNGLHAQFTRYLVKFKNKGTSPYSITNPSVYLSTKALARRSNYNIALDSSDLPITPRYIDSVRLAGSVTILNASKWLNQISIQTNDAAALSKISNFTFVQSVSSLAAKISDNPTLNPHQKFDLERKIGNVENMVRTQNTAADFYNYGNTYNEVHLHNGEFLHNIGMRGQNMLVAVLDAGFYQYTSLKSFDSINANNQVLQTWDFVAREASVVEDDSHGMSCFSTIAGNIPGQFVGNAPKANFVLYRTEDAPTEYPIEEHNWACGAERADSIGADIISSSLGYTTFDNAIFDHTYADMNGRTNISTRAAVVANRKGLLSFVAAGNDGNNSWHYLSSPSDADSIVTVGAVNTSGVIGGFSSYGPSSDGRVKPEVAAVGVSAYVQNANNTIGPGNGTSYSTPKMAGLGTCLWQAFPEFNNIAIRDALIKAGNKYTAPDNRVGYGIPDMKKAFIVLLNQYAKITLSTNANCKTTLQWKSKDVGSMKYEIERKLPNETVYSKVGELQGTGSILSNKTGLQFIDNSVVTGTVGTLNYRIKQIIDTSAAGLSSTYFDSVSIVIATPCSLLGIVVPPPPNPTLNITVDRIAIMPTPVAANQFTLRVETPYAVPNLNIRITDMKGSILSQLKKSKTTGRTDFVLNIAALSKGNYNVAVYNGEVLIANGRLVRL